MSRLLCAFLIAATGGAWADPSTTPALASASPYSGQETRDIKSLAPSDVTDYLAGKGMGLAKAAELNGYAGPAHVLELAKPLALTTEQQTSTQALFAAMQASAIELGRSLVEQERRLDHLFATQTVTPEALDAALQRIGELQARLRATHLQAHLSQVAILTPQQNLRYSELRGYTGKNAGHGTEHKH